ncbi:MAG: acyloxyacyl hydrolase [Bacteroidetes bacterium]|nr:acyloxyacyl hydrolase [Bacteroidota bacterium]
MKFPLNTFPAIYRGIWATLMIVFISLANNQDALAQFTHKRISSNLMVNGKVAYGFLIPHHLEMEILNSHFTAYEISISKATYGRTRWEYMYNYPVIGIAYWYSSLGTSPYLGNAHALMPYIDFPLTYGKEMRIFFRTALGIGYITNHFDRLENYKNIAIGSHWNAAVAFTLEMKQKVSERFIVSLGLGFNHFSNGSMKTPNYGINIPNASASLSYRLSKENPYFRKKLLPELRPFYFDGKKSLDLNIAGGLGYKNMNAEMEGKFLAWDIFTGIMKDVSYKSSVGVGLDASYDGTDEIALRQKYGETSENNFEMIKTGFEVGYALNMSRISFVGNLGYYLSGRYQGDGKIYEKIGIWCEISRDLFAHVTLKAHAGRADFLTLGIGYKIELIYY